MLNPDDLLARYGRYALAIAIITLLIVGECELGAMLTASQLEDCIAVLLNRN
jgi:hypothetical protein